ncbi:MAG: Asp23/Gls24 family envelope stress response protein [Clostridia bacterium]|nr:Asp23/Gls24 family envelope stress response protein [Clostridia bacterium]
MKVITKKGTISISEKIIALIAGYAALNCFGVKGMVVRNFSDELTLLLKGENFHKGVKVRTMGNYVSIELHIAVQYGMNMSAVSRAIMEEVQYVVEHQTGLKVSAVDVHIDTIILAD